MIKTTWKTKWQVWTNKRLQPENGKVAINLIMTTSLYRLAQSHLETKIVKTIFDY
jgi:hypothetical protein